MFTNNFLPSMSQEKFRQKMVENIVAYLPEHLPHSTVFGEKCGKNQIYRGNKWQNILWENKKS